MKSGAGHRKGAEFERTIAKRLSLWLSQGHRDDLLWRSAMSGGRATIGLPDMLRSTQAGDLIGLSHKAFEFVDDFYIELKFYNKLDLDTFIYASKGLLAAFWRLTQDHASKFNKVPVLIYKENRRPICVCVEHKTLGLLWEHSRHQDGTYPYGLSNRIKALVITSIISIYKFDDVFPTKTRRK